MPELIIKPSQWLQARVRDLKRGDVWNKPYSGQVLVLSVTTVDDMYSDVEVRQLSTGAEYVERAYSGDMAKRYIYAHLIPRGE